MSKSVFVSYSSQDKKEVEQIIDLLDKNQISYWKAPEMIPAGSNYAREIPKAIRECDVFLLLISKTSQESIWVEKEIDCAVNNRKTIVPIKFTEAPLSDMFRFYLNNVQTISCTNKVQSALNQMIERLQVLLHMDKVIEEPAKPSANLAENLKKDGLDGGRERRKKASNFSMNPQPVSCSFCGGELKKVSRGIYQCVDCGKENYDTFRIVRNYLEKAGPCTVDVIVKETGVPRKSVDYFFKEEMLEIPKSSSLRLSCERCGAPIRTGVLCDNCKAGNRGLPTRNLGKFHSTKYQFNKKD